VLFIRHKVGRGIKVMVPTTEAELFAYLKQDLYPDLVKSEGTYDTFDCISYKAGHFIELKCRVTHYSDLLIEQMKYRKLIEQAVQSNLLPFYINSTPLGIYSFDLNDIPEPEWVTHLMPATTDFENKAKVPKVVGYLEISEAIKL
jgi:hypothetical protein